MKSFTLSAFLLLCACLRLSAAVAFYFDLGGQAPLRDGVGTLILDGNQLTYDFAVTGAHPGNENPLTLCFSAPAAAITLPLAAFHVGSGGSGCNTGYYFSGPRVANQADLSEFRKAVDQDAVWTALSRGYCDALLPPSSWVSGTVAVTDSQAALIRRGGFAVELPTAGKSSTTLAATRRWAGIVRDVYGKAVADLDIHLWRPSGAGWEHAIARSDATGRWSTDLPVGLWLGAARPADLLARGYFCFPGFTDGSSSGLNVICNSTSISIGDPLEGFILVPACDLWGPGFIDWNSGPTLDPGNVTVTVFPTKPSLRVARTTALSTTVEVSFETQQTLPMTTTRRWRVEKSTNLQNWATVQTVALGNLSPLLVTDARPAPQASCYYRATLEP